MPLAKTLDILKACEEGKYAVGAFNINSLDQPQALIKKAEELRSPILIVEPGIIESYVNFRDCVLVTSRAAEAVGIPVGIHLSHGLNLEQFERAFKAGFTSVMYDGSKLSYDENVENTRRAVDIGHKHGCAVEGELGALGSSFANVAESMTDPAMARDFVTRTGVDILAVSVGNAHGFYKGKPNLDFKRLEEIRNAVKSEGCYLTLHGGTGIPEDHLKRSIELGIVKICIYTEMCSLGKNRARVYTASHPDYEGNLDIPNLIASVLGGFTEAEAECMRMFMSIGRVSIGSAAPDSSIVNKEPGPPYPSRIAENPSLKGNTVFWDRNV
jgi:fructose-bisphosphate aldolase class II